MEDEVGGNLLLPCAAQAPGFQRLEPFRPLLGRGAAGQLPEEPARLLHPGHAAAGPARARLLVRPAAVRGRPDGSGRGGRSRPLGAYRRLRRGRRTHLCAARAAAGRNAVAAPRALELSCTARRQGQ